MAKKPRRDKVQTIIRDLLGSEIPEIQTVAKQLSERIKQLEEHSLKLHEYVDQIEDLAVEEADALVESRISELLRDLDKSLTELKQRSRATTPTPQPEPKIEKKIVVEEKAEESTREAEREAEKEVVEEAEEIMPHASLTPPTYMTPEGYKIRKSRH